MTAFTRHRLDGLEPDNLLAFLALLGLLRALEARDRQHAEGDKLRPRAAWDIDHPPLRPELHLACATTTDELVSMAWEGMSQLSSVHEFEGREKLKLTHDEARKLFKKVVSASSVYERLKADLWAALVAETNSEELATKTPFCVLDMAQTAFLKTLANVCDPQCLPGRGDMIAKFMESLKSALFFPWDRMDKTASFRWDPVEDSRHAYRWTAPTDDKQGVQHGANALAAVALPIFPIIAQLTGIHKRTNVIGGYWQRGTGDGTNFSFAWPIWREPATLSAIRALLAHPKLREPNGLAHFGVDQVMITRRISVGKYMNFTRARPLAETRESARAQVSRRRYA